MKFWVLDPYWKYHVAIYREVKSVHVTGNLYIDNVFFYR